MRRASAQVTLFAPLEASPPLSGPASMELCSSQLLASRKIAEQQHIIQWIGLREKLQENPHIYWENPWFPADFPLNQSIESCFILILSVFFSICSRFFSHHQSCPIRLTILVDPPEIPSKTQRQNGAHFSHGFLQTLLSLQLCLHCWELLVAIVWLMMVIIWLIYG